MNLKALVTSLVLATSSVAMAKPLLQVDYDADLDLSIRDHRGAWRPTWSPLSTAITGGRRTMIDVTENRRNDLTALRLQSVSGATYIYSMTLIYENGRRENIEVGKWLYSNQPMLTFDLPQQRKLDKIMLRTWAGQASKFQVFGKQMNRIDRPRPPVVEPLPPPPPLPPMPVTFMAGKDLTFANTPGYVHLPVGVDKGRFDKLRVEATGASTFIGHIHVTFVSGAHQTIDINKTMYRGEVLEFELDGKAKQTITSLTVMQSHDVRQVGPSAGRFNVVLL